MAHYQKYQFDKNSKTFAVIEFHQKCIGKKLPTYIGM